MLLTRSPLIHPASWASAFDLHVLSTPPAFVLSQDQTLRTKTKTLKPRKTNQKTRSAIPTKNTQKQKTGIKKQTNTLSSSQTTPTQPKTHKKHVSDRHSTPPNQETKHLASITAVRRNKENNTHVRADRQIITARSSPRSFSAEFQASQQILAHKIPKTQHFSCHTTQNNKQNVRQAAQSRNAIRPTKHPKKKLSSHPYQAEPGCPRSADHARHGVRPWRQRGRRAYRRHRG